jgi:spermidine/putrescine transport system ATP-binding protein
VYITHDQSEALVMSDRVAVMNRGRFEQVGTPRQLYGEPATRFVAGFVGDSNQWSGRLVAEAPAALRLDGGTVIRGVSGADEARADGPAACFVRPEAIALAEREEALGPLANRFCGRVASVLFDGANSTVLIDTPSFAEPVRATLPQAGPLAGLAAGAPVHFGWAADAARILAR